MCRVVNVLRLSHRDNWNECASQVEQTDAYHVTLSCTSQWSAAIALHYCYPQIPNALVVEHLQWHTGAARTAGAIVQHYTQRVEATRQEANQQCFANLMDVYEFLARSLV